MQYYIQGHRKRGGWGSVELTKLTQLHVVTS